jgi:hypothetical protein
MTEAQLDALQGYVSAVCMYVAGDGNYGRLARSHDLLRAAFDKALPDLFADAPAKPRGLADIDL